MRRPAIDALRGFVVILMALDHTQFFWSVTGLYNDGLNGFFPVYTSAWHQITRFLSHLCAPTFLFLAGMMMSWDRDRRKILKRILLLLILQFTLENIAWWPAGYLQAGYRYFGILSCIGLSMLFILLLTLSGLKTISIFFISIGTILVSQVISHEIPHTHAFWQGLAIIVYAPTLDHLYPMTSLFTLLQWFGFMGIGYSYGSRISQKRLGEYWKETMALGVVAIGGFFMVRCYNGFGNFLHWDAPFSREFFILSKYPPDLSFTLFMFGILWVVLGLLIKWENKLRVLWMKPFLLFGKKSLFFYVVHLYVYGAVAYVLGQRVGVSLGTTWAVWCVGLVIMYYLCSAAEKLDMKKILNKSNHLPGE